MILWIEFQHHFTIEMKTVHMERGSQIEETTILCYTPYRDRDYLFNIIQHYCLGRLF